MQDDKDLISLKALAEAATPGPWYTDRIENEGEYGGGPDTHTGFWSQAVCAEDSGLTLFDTLNSDACTVEGDEDGAYDSVGHANAKFVAAANPQAILSLISRLESAEAAYRDAASSRDGFMAQYFNLSNQIGLQSGPESSALPASVDLSGLTRFMLLSTPIGMLGNPDPSGAYYRVEDVQALLAAPARDVGGLTQVYAECRECHRCGHVGINDSADGKAACHNCDWSGPSPVEDHCPGCANDNCMGVACPECGALYELIAETDITTPAAQAAQAQGEPVAWAVTAPLGGIHKLAITRESADRKCARWLEEWPNNKCSVRPLVFGDTPTAPARAVGTTYPGSDGFTMARFKSDDVPVGTTLYVSAQADEGGRK